MVKFVSMVEKSVLKNPLNNFAEETQVIELRQDPLLGTWSRINIARALRTHQVQQSGNDAAKIIESTRKNCFFCKAGVFDKTPEIPEKMGLGKRLAKGGSVLFPNLYPFAKYHAVCVLSGNHSANLGEIGAKNLENALALSIMYLKAAHASDKSAKFGSINMNYMPPSAASIIHPHMQIICDSKPTVYQKAVYDRSKAYYRKEKKNYFTELAKTDKVRKVMSGKKSVWVATFAPVLANDLTGIFAKKSSFFELSAKDIRDMASDISRIFSAIWKVGGRSANMSIFSAPFPEKSGHFSLHARIGTRPAMQPNYTADKGFLEVLHQETVVSTVPEEVAKAFRKALSADKHFDR